MFKQSETLFKVNNDFNSDIILFNKKCYKKILK